MFVVYSLIALFWGWLCYQHIHELLPIQVCGLSRDSGNQYSRNPQYYLSGLVGLLVIEMLANWGTFSSCNPFQLSNYLPSLLSISQCPRQINSLDSISYRWCVYTWHF